MTLHQKHERPVDAVASPAPGPRNGRKSLIHNARRLQASIALSAAVALLSITCAPRAADAQGIPVRLSTRSMAMGGATLLSGGPIETGYLNPGALGLTGGFHVYIPMFQVTSNKDVVDMFNWVSDHKEDFQNFNSMSLLDKTSFATEVADEFNNRWVNLLVDPMIGIQIGHLSVSAYSVTNALLQVYADTNPLTPAAGINIWPVSDLVLNAGFGFQLAPLIHAGVGVRYMQRNYTVDPISLDVSDFENTFDVFGEALSESNETLNGFAVDAGATFTLTKAFAVGGVIRGLVNSVDDPAGGPPHQKDAVIGAGVRLKPLELLMGIPLFIIKDLTLEADLMDITGSYDQDFMDRIQLGAEAKIHPILPIPVYLRAGYGLGKLSLGAGLHFLVLDLGAALVKRSVYTPNGFQDVDFYSLSIGIGW
jgi:hypothetical protein